MLLWIILTTMTAAAAVWLSVPLLRNMDHRRQSAASALEVYCDQLVEVAREQTDGAIDAEQAEAASREIKRRMLSVQPARDTNIGKLSLGQQHLAVASVAGLVALGSVILYAHAGRPDLPSVSRPPTSLVLGNGAEGPIFRSAQGWSQRIAGALPSGSSVETAAERQAAAPRTAAPGLGSVDDMMLRLVERLKKDPANVETWRMLGWSYFSTERYVEAADAYRKAAGLAAPTGPTAASRSPTRTCSRCGC